MRTPRYGARLRNLYDAADKTKKDSYICPKCGKKSVKRISYALWECKAKSCKVKIAGGAYMLTTEIGGVAKRVIDEYSKA